MPSGEDRQEKSALETLSIFLERHTDWKAPFSPTRLKRVVGIPAERATADCRWLAKHGYIENLGDNMARLTRKGRYHGHDSRSEDGFTINFTESKKNSPDEDRG